MGEYYFLYIFCLFFLTIYKYFNSLIVQVSFLVDYFIRIFWRVILLCSLVDILFVKLINVHDFLLVDDNILKVI
jgi:hypothetical protein